MNNYFQQPWQSMSIALQDELLLACCGNHEDWLAIKDKCPPRISGYIGVLLAAPYLPKGTTLSNDDASLRQLEILSRLKYPLLRKRLERAISRGKGEATLGEEPDIFGKVTLGEEPDIFGKPSVDESTAKQDILVEGVPFTKILFSIMSMIFLLSVGATAIGSIASLLAMVIGYPVGWSIATAIVCYSFASSGWKGLTNLGIGAIGISNNAEGAFCLLHISVLAVIVLFAFSEIPHQVSAWWALLMPLLMIPAFLFQWLFEIALNIVNPNGKRV